MATDPNLAEVILNSVLHGGVQLGVSTGFSYDYAADEVVIRGEGAKGPTAAPIVRSDLVAAVDFLYNSHATIPAIEPGTVASLIIERVKGTGKKLTTTLLTMQAMGFGEAFDRDNPPGRHRQNFRHVGSMANSAAAIGNVSEA